MPIIDVSRPLYTGSPHWPGDSATDYTFTARMADGKSCNVGKLSLSAHNGTHVDAPYHYNDRGDAIDVLPVELYVGPARVVDARGHRELTEKLFAGLSREELAQTPRILFRTD